MSILDELFGAEGAPAGGAPPADLPLEIPDPEPPEQALEADPVGGGSEVDVLRQLITLGREYTAIPTVEERERLEMEKATTIFQKLLADNEKMSDSLTGADPAMRKALGPRGAL